LSRINSFIILSILCSIQLPELGAFTIAKLSRQLFAGPSASASEVIELAGSTTRERRHAPSSDKT
jgi:hypothetical protein